MGIVTEVKDELQLFELYSNTGKEFDKVHVHQEFQKAYMYVY